MTEFMKWLRVELLRLRSLDWRNGSWTIHELKDGAIKFTSEYQISRLAARLGMPEDEILRTIDSPPILAELEGKSFTAHWRDKKLILAWLEEGIEKHCTEIEQQYHEEGGEFYQTFRWLDRIVYLDGTDRIVRDRGEPTPVKIPRETYEAALEHIKAMNNKEEAGDAKVSQED